MPYALRLGAKGATANGVYINISAPGYDGVLIDADDAELRNCYVEAGHDAVIIDGASRAVVAGNTLRWPGRVTNNTYDAIRLEGTGSECVILDNFVHSDSTSKPRYGVNISVSTHTDTYVYGNVLLDAATASINDAGTTSHFDVETNGSDTIADTNSSVTVSHGLPFAPTSVVVTPNKDEHVWVTAKTATQFTLNRAGTSGALAVDWVAALPK